MSKAIKVFGIGVLIAVVIAVTIFAINSRDTKEVGTVSTTCQGSTTCLTDLVLSGQLSVSQGILELSSSAVNVFAGTTAMNNVIQSSSGYSQTYSTAAGTVFNVTPAQFCSAATILVPVSNTTTITVVLPSASTTYATCGATTGSWSNQIFQNDSSFSVTIATSTGGTPATSNSVFYFATGTPASSITYPPKIIASTSLTFMGQYISPTSIYYYLGEYSRSF
jgi:hypothetical protein